VRKVLLAAAALAVLLVAGGFAVFALRGGDAPPPPALSREPAPEAAATADGGAGEYEVRTGAPTFVGYRVREEFVTVGVVDAVGRTDRVTGTLTLRGDRVVAGRLRADMTTLRSDESRRDEALRRRGIETDRFPTATFELTQPFRLSRRAVTARGRLTLHGQARPVAARVSGQRAGADVELAGEAPVAFDRFGIEPPSVAGFVTVRDTGALEFLLRLAPR
jgi:polyisoprenoid-binding protein YceI